MKYKMSVTFVRFIKEKLKTGHLGIYSNNIQLRK